MRLSFLLKYWNKLNNGCFTSPYTMGFVHCQEIYEQQHQSEVSPWWKTRKETNDPPTASSIQRNMFKEEVAASLYKLEVYTFTHIFVYIHI